MIKKNVDISTVAVITIFLITVSAYSSSLFAEEKSGAAKSHDNLKNNYNTR